MRYAWSYPGKVPERSVGTVQLAAENGKNRKIGPQSQTGQEIRPRRHTPQDHPLDHLQFSLS